MDSSFSFIGIVIQENRRDVVRMDRGQSKRILGGTGGVWVQLLGHSLDDLSIYLSIVRVEDTHFLIQGILLLFPGAEDGLLQLVGEIGMVVRGC